MIREVGFSFASWWFSKLVWHRAHLESGVDLNRASPDTFWIPSSEEKAQIAVGDHVKLVWCVQRLPGERMWVEVTSRSGDDFAGRLRNDPVFVYASCGGKVTFGSHNIIDFAFAEEDPAETGDGEAA